MTLLSAPMRKRCCFKSEDEDMWSQRATHNIQLCLDSTEPFAWHSNRHPKLQLLSGRLMSDEVDIEMLKTWLRMSDSVASTTNFHSQPAADAGAQLRLIDVSEGRLITSTTASVFAILSYVWGGPQPFILTKNSEAKLYKPGAIMPENPQLGRTIADALRLCRLINYRYLWVDALCICQDDKEEVAAQIAYMNRIYQSAALAIVQASADPDTSVHTPLRGLLPGSRKIRQEQVLIQDEKVLCTHRPPFTAGHVFCEDAVFEHEKDDIHAYSRVFVRTLEVDWDYDPLAKELLPTPAEALLYLVSHYTERLLSNQDDALAAFSALMTTFVHDLGFADFGIPREIFDYAFCWSPAGSVRRRAKFPSWSWAGWEGSIRFHHDFHPERCRSAIQLLGYSLRPSFAGKTIIDGAKNRFKKLRETHGLQIGPLALTEEEVHDYYRNLLGHDRRGGNPVHERSLLHFVTTGRSLQIGAIEQNPPGPAKKEEAGEGRVEKRHAGSFYKLKGTEGTKLPQLISIVKEWRLSQPDLLSVDFIAICTALTWKSIQVSRAEDDGSVDTEADEEQSSDELDDNVPTKKGTRKFALETNACLNLVPVTWGHARACGCCDRRHKVARRIGQMSVVTMPWNDCVKEWIASKPRETLVYTLDSGRRTGSSFDDATDETAGGPLKFELRETCELDRFYFDDDAEYRTEPLESNTDLDMSPSSNNAIFAVTDFLAMCHRTNRRQFSKITADTIRLYTEGAIRPVRPQYGMVFSEASDAFRLLQRKKHDGKVVLQVPDDDPVPDSMFEMMEFFDFCTALTPKQKVTLNLHKMLPRDLDFHLCMPSAAGQIGSIAQSDYNLVDAAMTDQVGTQPVFGPASSGLVNATGFDNP
ncbi:hypothetical protein DL771_008789 [Monosporascus sp. 5C6A]|nr:hypothetical protein DL771_008789 [Monosporascus sp. 5C6A]